jgi:hypothetical protein
VKIVCDWCKLSRIKTAIIIADNDPQGQEGASELQQNVVHFVSKVKLISPPSKFKDLRQWVVNGATHKDVANTIDRADTFHAPRITYSWQRHRSYYGPFQTIISTLR